MLIYWNMLLVGHHNLMSLLSYRSSAVIKTVDQHLFSILLSTGLMSRFFIAASSNHFPMDEYTVYIAYQRLFSLRHYSSYSTRNKAVFNYRNEFIRFFPQKRILIRLNHRDPMRSPYPLQNLINICCISHKWAAFFFFFSLFFQRFYKNYLNTPEGSIHLW